MRDSAKSVRMQVNPGGYLHGVLPRIVVQLTEDMDTCRRPFAYLLRSSHASEPAVGMGRWNFADERLAYDRRWGEETIVAGRNSIQSYQVLQEGT